MSGLTQPTDTSPNYADAVLEGGGVRGIGHVGALAVASIALLMEGCSATSRSSSSM